MVKICKLHTMLDGRVVSGGVSVKTYKSVASAKGAMTAYEGGRPPMHMVDPVAVNVFHDHFPERLRPRAHGTMFVAPFREVGDIPEDARGIWFTEVFICEEEVAKA